MVVSVVLAGCGESLTHHLVSTYSGEDGRAILELLLTQADFKKVADRVAPVKIAAIIEAPNGTSETFLYEYADGKVTNATGGKADFTLTTTRDIALGVLNADTHFAVFACALHDNAVTLVPNNLLYAASFNAAKGRIIGNIQYCHAGVYDKVTYQGLDGTILDGSEHNLPPFIARMGGPGSDFLVFNTWRAPTAWLPGSVGTFCKIGIISDYCSPEEGFSGSTVDFDHCYNAVQIAYTPDFSSSGWDAGRRAAQEASKSAEFEACRLIVGGS